MSFNRLHTDAIAYANNLQRSSTTLSYLLDPISYENGKKRRHELGLIGGAEVSQIKGNIVDLESELRGQTRYLSMCAEQQWNPTAMEDNLIRNDKTPAINVEKRHLPAFQMISHKAIPLPPPMELTRCTTGSRPRTPATAWGSSA